MTDVTLSDALEEAYASAPAARALIDTLSIWYDGLLIDGEPSEVYIYQGFTGDRENSDGVPLKDFRLEAAARYSGGEVCEFIAVPFNVVLPGATNNAISKGQLVVDGVGREISDILMQAVEAGASIEITYRAYLEGMEFDGPQNLPPLVFGLSNVSVNQTEVRGEITAGNVGNRRFPADLYKSARFPSLR